MSVDSAASLIDVLRQSRLLAPNQLDEVTRSLLQSHRDSRSLARALMERDWLTPYQVNQLLQGRSQDLVLGSYVVLERLNESFVGTVFKARHQHMKRLVSLIVVRESLLRQAEAVNRFYQEIQAASQLTHPHILCAFDAGPIERTHFFAMEYVEGIDLDQLVRQSGPLPPAVAATFLRQAAIALHYAGQRRLLHHDLRPANLLVARLGARSERSPASGETPRPAPESYTDASIKVCNLGLTLLQPRARGTFSADSSMDEAAQLQATVDYSAPEQAQGAALTDIRSNLYSLGCIFYYLLAGRPPFPGSDWAAKLKQHQTQEPTPIQALRPEIPAATAAVLARLLAKRPEGRYQSPAALAAALAALPGIGPALADGTRDSRPATPMPDALAHAALAPSAAGQRRPVPFAQVAPPPRRHKPRFIAAVAGMVVLAAGTALALWLGGGRPEPVKEPETGQAVTPVRQYRKGTSREQSVLQTLKACGLPTLEGKWHFIGPFDNTDKKGFDAVYPPEQEIDLAKNYKGKADRDVAWQEIKNFQLGKVFDLRAYTGGVKPGNPVDNVAVYLYQEMDAAEAAALPVSFGSDDTLTVWFNNERIVSQNVYRGLNPNDARTTLNVRLGKNRLLIKVCQGSGEFAVYVSYPGWPPSLESTFGSSLQRDFPAK